MENFRIYLLRIIAVALLSGVFRAILGKTTFQKPIGFLLGIVMLLTVMQPLSKWQFTDSAFPVNRIMQRGEEIVDDGVMVAEKAKTAIITDKMNTYIVKKAAQLGAQLTVNVQTDMGMPCKVTISGDASPYVQSLLTSWIASDMGIPREAQNWN